MTWQVVFAANLVVAVAYSGVCFAITRGLRRSGQFGLANPLGTMTAAIFFSCGVGHWLHALHLAEPWLGFAGAVGLSSRAGVDWHMAVWDTGTAIVAVGYLSLRRHYGQLVIEAVVSIAKGLGSLTVAEFVGSDETLEILRRLGVDHGQGFHLAAPTSVDPLFPPALPA